MKRLAALAGLLALAAGTAFAVITPLRLNFQGKLLDPATNQPKNGNVLMKFVLYDAPTGGTTLATDPTGGGFVNVPVNNGVFSYSIGTGTLLTADMFRGASVYVGVQVSGDSEMTPRIPLAMAAYSFTAMQLVSDSDIRVNSGIAYSTFTTLGNLQVDNGVAAATGSFSAQGNDVYSVFSSSGLYMSSGTLRLAAASLGLDASGTGVVASTGNFRSTLDGVYALTVSSGIVMSSGTLAVQGPGGVDVRYGVKASTYVGNGSDLVGTTPQVSNSSGSATTALVANTEVVVISTNIAPLRNNKTVLLIGFVQVNRVANAVATCTVRYRVNTAGACTTGSTQFYAYTFTVANTASNTALTPVLAQHSPASTADISYCLTLVCNAAHTFSSRSLNLMTAAP